MWRDLRYAIQALWRSPAFTIAAALGLGLAIGANATIFGLVDGLWFRPPGVRAPGGLVHVFSTSRTDPRGAWSFPEYTAIRDTVGALDGVVARGRRGATIRRPDGTSELLLVNVVSSNFFTVLGVAPSLGSLFGPGDEAALEAQPGIVLGYACWQRRFGSDVSIVGRTISLDRGVPLAVRVLGVLPPSFRDLDAAADRDLWIPPQTWMRLANRDEFLQRDFRWFDVVARRKPGSTAARAGAEVAALAAAFARDYPAVNAGRGARVISDLDYRLEAGGVNALALLGLVLLVVLITCVNLANLLIARAVARRQELAMRVALGASRWRLVRQMLTESAVIGAAGAVVGITVALWLIRLLPSILVQPPGFQPLLVFRADARVFAFTLLVTGVTTILFSLAPAWMSARANVAPLIKGDARLGAPAGGDRMVRNLMVIAQVAVSLVLLCAAGVLARSFAEARRADLGFARKPVLTAWVSGDASPAAARHAVSQLTALPGVSRVAVALRAPLSLSGNGLARPVSVAGAPDDATAGVPSVKFNAISANYFEVLGTRVTRGRPFGDAEDRPGDPVAIVNERFAAQFFPGSDALGRLIRIAGVDHRIVGLVQNAAINDVGEPPEPYLYLPYWRGSYPEITYMIDSARPVGELVPAVRDLLKHIDPRLEPSRLITMAEYIRYSAGTYQATAALAAALGVLGLVLTAIGVYGVVAYRTSRRTREIGLRIALGAPRGQVVRLIFGEGARTALIGVLAGLPAALLVTRLMSSLLFGIDPWDLPAFGGAAALLLVAVGVATLVPAWRATRVAPSTALRDV